MNKLHVGRLGIPVLAILVVAAAAVIGHDAAAGEQHPNLFLNAQELQNLREKLKTEPWREELLKQVKADADTGNAVACAIVYAITQEEPYGSKARTQLVGTAANYLQSKPKNPEYPWGPEAANAITFDFVFPLLNADQQQTAKAYLRQLALDGIEYHKGHPLTPNMSFVCHWRIGLIGYAIPDPEIIEWATNEPGPPWGRNNPGRVGGFKQRIEHTLVDGTFWDEATIYGNFSILGMMLLAEAAQHYDGTDLYNYTSPNGGSLRKAVAGLVSLAYPVERTGVNKGSVRMATIGDGSTAPPNRINSEAGDAYFVNKPNVYPERQNLFPIVELACHAWKEPVYAYLLSLNPNRSEKLGWFEYVPASLLWGESVSPNSPPAAMPSAVYPQAAIAVLRSDESPNYWTSRGLVVVHQMGRSYGHQHLDKFELVLWGKGRLLYPDWNAQQYEPFEYGWTRNGWAHSTLIVDQANPKGGASTNRHEFSEDAKFLATTSTEIYPDLTQTRAFILAREYLLDFFWASSPRERTFDWFIHGIGRLSLPLDPAFQPSNDLVKPYHWVLNERKRETGDAWQASFIQRSGGVIRGMGAYNYDWFYDTVGVRMTLLGEPGTTAYGGEGAFNPVPNAREYGNPEGTIPLVMARRKAAATCFAALHEPFDKQPVLTVEKFGEIEGAVGVTVRGIQFTDYAVVSLAKDSADELMTIQDRNDAAQLFSCRNYGYLRVAGKKIAARGGWDAFRVYAPDVPDKAGLALNGKDAPYTKQGGYVLFGNAGPAGAVAAALHVTKASIETERAVPGQTVKVVVTVQNSGTAPAAEGTATLAASPAWPANPPQQKLAQLAPGATAEIAFAVTVPKDARPGTACTLAATLKAGGVTVAADAGKVLVIPTLGLSFDPPRINIAKGAEMSILLGIVNNSPQDQEGVIELVTPKSIQVEPRRVPFPRLIPGQSMSFTVKLKAGTEDTAGEIAARVAAVGAEGKLPFNVGITIGEEERNELFPMWIVRAPGYEMQIHKKYGTSRTVIDAQGNLLYGSEWWGGSGIPEVRMPTGAEDTAPIAWNKKAKSVRWQGHTLEVVSEAGEAITATFGETAIRYRFSGKPGLEYRASINSFFRLPSGVIRTPENWGAAGIPATVGGLYWSFLQNPDLSPNCVVTLTPRQPAAWTDRPVTVSPYWMLKDGDQFVIGFVPEEKIAAMGEEGK